MIDHVKEPRTHEPADDAGRGHALDDLVGHAHCRRGAEGEPQGYHHCSRSRNTVPTKFERSEARDDRVERDREDHAIEPTALPVEATDIVHEAANELGEADLGKAVHEMDAQTDAQEVRGAAGGQVSLKASSLLGRFSSR